MSDLPVDDSIGATLASLLVQIRESAARPGDRFPSERRLAEEYGVSRNTVRESIALLEYMRIVERRRNSGIYLRDSDSVGSLEELVLAKEVGLPFVEASVKQMYEVRRILELSSIGLACHRRTQSDIEVLESVLTRTEDKLQRGMNIAEEDAAFHSGLLKATGNDLLVRITHPLWIITRERREFFFQNASNARESLREHKQILEAVTAKDAVSASGLLEQHIGKVDRYWTDFVRRNAASENWPNHD